MISSFIACSPASTSLFASRRTVVVTCPESSPVCSTPPASLRRFGLSSSIEASAERSAGSSGFIASSSMPCSTLVASPPPSTWSHERRVRASSFSVLLGTRGVPVPISRIASPAHQMSILVLAPISSPLSTAAASSGAA